jgi:hypothetical protein
MVMKPFIKIIVGKDNARSTHKDYFDFSKILNFFPKKINLTKMKTSNLFNKSLDQTFLSQWHLA